ncbi:hypothetical protein DAPPUDRAFT_264381 [Daphnia pulex]|uniref:Uncharacterized protein n=1 Tax=Daphnia pulex TaxID=6669 RepID=E9HRG9_DAPPU|nr:hypothetical protein DAPPUDRAFT_264381 [Daphnia pulex]|eukprot:EFX65662.1 hypothetical protein DAPPUDRAFT_264381 [Daphnia pulex]
MNNKQNYLHPNCFRLISILNSFSKMFKKVFLPKLKGLESSQNWFSPIQHGFRPEYIGDLGFFRNRALARLRIGFLDFKGAEFIVQTAKKAESSYALMESAYSYGPTPRSLNN